MSLPPQMRGNPESPRLAASSSPVTGSTRTTRGVADPGFRVRARTTAGASMEAAEGEVDSPLTGSWSRHRARVSGVLHALHRIAEPHGLRQPY